MENTTKAIMIGVGLFITIIVIAAVMLITGIGQDMLNSGTNQLSGISEQMNFSVLNSYNGDYDNGSLAKVAAQNIMDLGGTVYLDNSREGNFSMEITTALAINRTLTVTASGYMNGWFYTGNKYECKINGTKATFTIVRE